MSTFRALGGQLPHCGSPEIEDEHGNVYPTDVEDRLSTYDRDGNPRPGVVVRGT